MFMPKVKILILIFNSNGKVLKYSRIYKSKSDDKQFSIYFNEREES